MNVSSPPVRVDTTPPSVSLISVLSDQRATAAFATSDHIEVELSCTDFESGIRAIRLSVGTHVDSDGLAYDLIDDAPVVLLRNRSDDVADTALRLAGIVNATHVLGRVAVNISGNAVSDGAAVFASVACINRAGARAMDTSTMHVVLDTKPPVSGTIRIPELHWSVRANAWIAKLDDGRFSHVSAVVYFPGFVDTATNTGNMRRKDDGSLFAPAFVICVGSAPLTCSDPEITTSDVRQGIQMNFSAGESHVNVWLTDAMGFSTASSSRVFIDSSPPILGHLAIDGVIASNGTAVPITRSTFVLSVVGGAQDLDLEGVTVSWETLAMDGSSTPACDMFAQVSSFTWRVRCASDETQTLCLNATAINAVGLSTSRVACVRLWLGAPTWAGDPPTLRFTGTELLLNWNKPTSYDGLETIEWTLCTDLGCSERAPSPPNGSVLVPLSHPILVNASGQAWAELVASNGAGLTSRMRRTDRVFFASSTPGAGTVQVGPNVSLATLAENAPVS